MPDTYSYLGPAGTFTWAALNQVDAARGHVWRSVNNVGEALADVDLVGKRKTRVIEHTPLCTAKFGLQLSCFVKTLTAVC